jgi:hypothetical protein
MRIRIAFLLAVALTSGTAAAAATDTRQLTADERARFERLLCVKPTMQGTDLTCASLRGYPGDPGATAGATLSLDSIAYGSFSKAGADEAYLSYGSSVEPHANNFGGGVLLARAGSDWRLVDWYPGGQMDDCLALPGEGKTKMLCLAGYTGQGEDDSSVWVRELPFDNDVAVLKAQDQRGMGSDPAPEACSGREAVLLSIDALKRAEDTAAFAVAPITYATAKDVADACKGGRFADVKESKGEAKIVLGQGGAKAITPMPFAQTDY